MNITGRGAVATSQPLATEAAAEVLREGGSAVDAAISANAMLCLVEPTGAGIGGDLFVQVWNPGSRRLEGWNASGRSSLTASLEEMRLRAGGGRLPAHGALTVTVPGCVEGWARLHDRYGRLPWRRLLEPAIEAARRGFELTPVIAGEWARNLEVLSAFPSALALFAPPGFRPEPGARFRNPRLSDDLEEIAREGARAFYQGRIARAVAEVVTEGGGFLTIEDLAHHRSEECAPLSVRSRGIEVSQLPPNGQGLALLEMWLLLDGRSFRKSGFGSAETLHACIEAKKLAYEDRARWIADMDFVELPLDALLDPSLQRARAEGIDPAKAAATVEPTLPLPNEAEAAPPGEEPGDTVYLCTADSDGMLVSWIQSNFRGMGSGLVPTGCGFMLQNRGGLFDLHPGRPNSLAPGKRPFHTIMPGFACKDGRPWLCFGVMGGDFQPQGQLQILLDLCEFGMDPREAGRAPRWRHEGSSTPTGERAAGPGRVLLEPGFADSTLEGLRARGHAIEVREGGYGGYQAILVTEEGAYVAAGEPRKDGTALAF